MKYIAVKWPEIQDYMNHPDYPEKCFYDSNKDIYFIPEDWEYYVISEDYLGGDIGDLEDAMG